MNESFRGTGRTTRMLKEALAAALHGPNKTVIVVGWRDHHCLYMLQQMWQLQELNRIGHHVNFTNREIIVGGTGRILFRAASQGRFDFRSQRFEGYPPGTGIFIDHHTWEMHWEEEAARAANAKRAAKLAADREAQQARHTILPRAVEGYTTVVDRGAEAPVSCSVPGDASSSPGGSESSSGPCSAD